MKDNAQSIRIKRKLGPVILAIILPVLNLFSNKESPEFSWEMIHRWLLASTILYFLWYLLNYATHYGRKKKHQHLIMLATVFGSCAIAYSLAAILVFDHGEYIRWNLIIRLFLACIFFIIVQRVQIIMDDMTRLELEKQQMQSENYKAQLQELRTRVDPHFLFNSLNTLRVMVRSHDPDSEQFIMSLSDFYRQTLKYTESSIVKLAEELNVMKSYLYLVKTRNNGGIIVDISIDEKEALKYDLPTLSMQILMENCFKHNSLSPNNPLHITIGMDKMEYIYVRNDRHPKLTKAQPSGYGLENIRKRYELMGIADSILVTSNDDEFEVKLKLIHGNERINS